MNRKQRRTTAKRAKVSRSGDRMVDAAQGVTDELARGLACHKSGQLAEAERYYRRVLAVVPDHADALHLLGLVAHQTGHQDIAVELIAKAIQRNAANPLYHLNLGSALNEQSRLDDAVAAYREAIRLKPDFAEAHCNLGVSLRNQGKLTQAVAAYRRAIHLKPDLVEAHVSLGNALREDGKLDNAVAACRMALRIKGDLAAAHLALGSTLDEQGKLDEAVAAYREAIRIKPDLASAYCNLGIALYRMGQTDGAFAACRRAIELNPGLAEAHANLGNALREAGRLDDAVAACREATRINPRLADGHCNLGAALHAQGRLDEAIAAFRQALALTPDHADALVNLVVALTDQNRLDEAVDHYEQALRLRPDLPGVHDRLGRALFEHGRVAEALACFRRALAGRPDASTTLINNGVALASCGEIDAALTSFQRAIAVAPEDPMAHSALIFALNFDPAATASEHQAERSRWNERHARRFAPWQPHHNDCSADRRLRIGYVSPYFCSQAATYAFGGVIMCHDRDQFEVVCYSDTAREDDITRRLAGRTDRWHETRGLSDEELAELIRADRIDILVDLVGHMQGHRLLVFARKPAPIQVSAWGEPTGTGLAAMDYLFADRVLVPPVERVLLAERVLDLPNFLGYWVPDPIAERHALPGVARGHITFGSFSRFDKIQEPVLRVWARVMSALPGSRLVLKEGRAVVDAVQQARVTRVLAAGGIAAERVSFLVGRERSGHFEAYQDIDIALDPFPHGGGMTTLDALWMGVPVVTFAGRTISSRLAAATLTALGLTDFIASDIESYVHLAVAKASDLAALDRLHGTLRGHVATSAFGDPTQYTRAVEAAYRAIWRRWCETLALVRSRPGESNKPST
jgi:predicted O-linked N-acetylglucosamine transferase (SPINDLY family)